MKKLIAIAIILLVSEAHSAELFGAEINVFAGIQKINKHETVQLGIVFEWEHTVFDFSYGIQRVGWPADQKPSWGTNKWQSGSVVSFRGYPFNTQTIRPLITWVHMSDITRGSPFNNTKEPTSDYVGVGVTFDWKRFELDISTGILHNSFTETPELQIRLRYLFK